MKKGARKNQTRQEVIVAILPSGLPAAKGSRAEICQKLKLHYPHVSRLINRGWGKYHGLVFTTKERYDLYWKYNAMRQLLTMLTNGPDEGQQKMTV